MKVKREKKRRRKIEWRVKWILYIYNVEVLNWAKLSTIICRKIVFLIYKQTHLNSDLQTTLFIEDRIFFAGA